MSAIINGKRVVKARDYPLNGIIAKQWLKEVAQLAPKYNLEVKIFYQNNGIYSKVAKEMHKEKNKWSQYAPVIDCHYNQTPVIISNTQKNASQLRALFAKGKIPEKGSLMGTLVLYKPTDASRKIAEQLLKNVEAVMPRQDNKYMNVSGIVPIDNGDRGAREILSEDQGPVVLLEIGYGDNAVDNALMTAPDFKNRLAAAILKSFQDQGPTGR